MCLVSFVIHAKSIEMPCTHAHVHTQLKEREKGSEKEGRLKGDGKGIGGIER